MNPRAALLQSVGVMALLLAGPPLNACLNDTEINQQEREFRSRYQDAAVPALPAAAAPAPSLHVPGAVGMAVGVMAVIAAGMVAARRRTAIPSND